MEDVKWLIKKCGVYLLALLICVILLCLSFGKKGQNESKTSEMVSEPPVVISDNASEATSTEIVEEQTTDSSLWFLPQANDCLISEQEKEQIKDMALQATELIKEVYQDIEIGNGPTYSSNITNFSEDQVKEVVRLLGESGMVSVAEDVDMENSEAIIDFYASYLEKKDAMFTVFEVNADGLIGVITFVYRQDKLQTYYVGIGWKEGGVPELRDTLVSNVAEIKLTEKGYFIYAYEVVIPHASLRQYWRIKPLSEECRELGEKYLSGLDYQMYNLLVIDWDGSNVTDVLMPGLFDDLYRINTGNNFKTENSMVDAEIFERIMTTYLPVSVEQLRHFYEYDATANSYVYEQIYASPYPPFGEVINYSYNSDGTITLVVDGVWPDFNSDLAFRHTIVVQPFEDGTFKYLSNSIEQIELELPPIAKKKG